MRSCVGDEDTATASRVEVERQLESLVARPNRWGLGRSVGGPVVAADDPDVDDGVVWWALTLLYGVDLRHGPGEAYLHDHEQLAGWLEEFCNLSRLNPDARS
jgi:hypothetical protein